MTTQELQDHYQSLYIQTLEKMLILCKDLDTISFAVNHDVNLPFEAPEDADHIRDVLKDLIEKAKRDWSI